jgi:hypothetical protein
MHGETIRGAVACEGTPDQPRSSKEKAKPASNWCVWNVTWIQLSLAAEDSGIKQFSNRREEMSFLLLFSGLYKLL